jgi:threonine/homoserine/homoserine lactone efflux protein
MLTHLQSKTVLGLITILVVACVMALLGKLTPELVDVIKWVGASYMAVRAVANHAEGKQSG